MLGEFLWQLTPKGLSADRLVLVTGNGAATGTAGPFADMLTVPVDEVFIPMAWEVAALPVVGTTRLLWLSVYAVPTDLSTDRIIVWDTEQIQDDSATSTSQRFARSNSNLVIPPGYIVRCVANFDLANAGNFVTGRIYGFRLPKGNLVST
jgi:hypothetical protein